MTQPRHTFPIERPLRGLRAKSRRGGLTLLELLLAMALTIVLLAAVTSAMRFQLYTLDKSRASMEEAQLARAILRRLSDDIRGAVQEVPIDFSAATKLAQESLGGADASQLSGLAGGDAASLAGGDLAGIADLGMSADDLSMSADDLGSGSSVDMESLASSTSPAQLPGLYGTETALQIDVSRIPRLDEYQRMILVDANGLAQTKFPSDVKTVTYYVRPHDQLGGAATPEEAAENVSRRTALNPQQEQFAGGLVRREVDRAVALWKSENFPSDSQVQYETLLATEVVALQFRYWDGLGWLTEWDAASQQGMPRAIEIALVLDSEGVGEVVTIDLFAPNVGDFVLSTVDPNRTLSVYRQVVNLPLALIPAPEESTSTESTGEDSSAENESLEASGPASSSGGSR